jgi:hypothetical protein
MSFSSDLYQQGRTVEAISNVNSYGPFELDSEANRAVGCIDPRAEQRRKGMKNIIQTAGGGVGIAYDAGLIAVANGADSFDPYLAVARAPLSEGAVILTGHERCAFNLNAHTVIKEIARPSELTCDMMGRLTSTQFPRERSDIEKNIARITDAARRIVDAVQRIDPSELLGTIDSLEPNKLTVTDMDGDNHAGVWITNYHPGLALRRQVLLRGENPLEVQAYHDNYAAMLAMARNAIRLTPEQRGLWLGAITCRSAATAGVLIGPDPRIKIVEVTPNPDGLRFAEVPR